MTSSVQQEASTVEVPRAAKPRHIRELDGIRGIAAVVVVFHHVCFTSIGTEGWGPGILFLRSLSAWGSYGVDLFFVLSGFLITSLLIQAQTSKSYYQDFYWKRALRVLPLYILCLLAVLIFIPGSRDYVIISALFLSNFAWVLHISSVGPFWTLAIEEQFYVIWPTVVRRRSVAELSRWAIVIAVGAIVLRFIAGSLGHYNYAFTFFRCDGLASGALLACWMRPQPGGKLHPALRSGPLAGAFLLGVVLIALSRWAPHGPSTNWFLFPFGQTGIVFLSASLIAFVIVHTGKPWLAALRSPVFTFFGLISYAMYMVHLYIMFAYDYLRGPLAPGDVMGFSMRLVSILAITIALCLVTRYAIELPAMSLRKYVLSRPTPHRPGDAELPLGNM